MYVDELVWTLCGEVERRVTFEPAILYHEANAVAFMVANSRPEFYLEGKRVE